MNFELKQYLDFEGLSFYHQQLMDILSKNELDVFEQISQIKALIGEESSESKAASGLMARIENIESNIGDISQLGEVYKNLVTALIGEIERAQAAEKVLYNANEWGTLGQE